MLAGFPFRSHFMVFYDKQAAAFPQLNYFSFVLRVTIAVSLCYIILMILENWPDMIVFSVFFLTNLYLLPWLMSIFCLKFVLLPPRSFQQCDLNHINPIFKRKIGVL